MPDCFENPNLRGDLGHLYATKLSIKYIGILSRLEKKILSKKYDLMVLLSGPEPQRSILENQLKSEIAGYKGIVILIKGMIESEQKQEQIGNILYYNYMKSYEYEIAINESELVLCRSGYTTIMDLKKLEKKAFFIPTPGQSEQEYLSEKMRFDGFAPYCKQTEFNVSKLLETECYPRLKLQKNETYWNLLFDVFR